MRILFASRNYFPVGAVGGAQTSIKFLAQSFMAQGHEAAVLNLDDHEHIGLHEGTGVPEYRLKLRNLYTGGQRGAVAKALWHGTDRFGSLMDKAYADVIAAFRPDVVFTHVLAGLGTGMWRAARRSGVPIVHMVHDYYLLCIKSGMRNGQGNCVRSCGLCQTVAAGPDVRRTRDVGAVIYVSDHVQKQHEAAALFANAGAHIIHGSYEPAGPVPARPDRIDASVLTLGYFGRIAPDKGVAQMMDALRGLEGVNWRLRVGGNFAPGYEGQVREAAKGLPVEFLGVQAPLDFYSGIDALIVPSLWHDPAPRVVYEAGIHGVVPLVANRGGLPQLVGHGTRGLVFDVDDPASLRAAIAGLADDPRELGRLRDEWHRTSSEFSQGVVSQQVLDVLASVQ